MIFIQIYIKQFCLNLHQLAFDFPMNNMAANISKPETALIAICPQKFGIDIYQKSKKRQVTLSAAQFEKLASLKEDIHDAFEKQQLKEWVLEETESDGVDKTPLLKANVQKWQGYTFMHIRYVVFTM